MPIKRIPLVPQLFSLLLLAAAPSLANPYRAEIDGNIAELESRVIDNEARPVSHRPRRLSAIPQLRFRTRIAGYGRVEILLNRERQKTWFSSISDENGRREDRSEITLFQGEGRRLGGNPESFRVAASAHGRRGRRVLRLFFRSAEHGGRMFEIEAALGRDGALAKVKRAPESLTPGRECASRAPQAAHTQPGSAQPGAAGPALIREPAPEAIASTVVSFGTDADFEWFRKFGESSNAEIAGIVNIANAIYLNNLSMSLEIGNQNVWRSASQPYTTSNIDRLLTQLQTYTLNSKHLGENDLYYLFSGKNFENDVIGYAFIGVACTTPLESFGMIQHEPFYDPYTFAHEVGHSFGMEHDNLQKGTIMNSVVRPGLTIFSATSKAQARAHLISGGGNCLGANPGREPSSEITSLLLLRRFREKTGELIASAQVGGVAGGNCSIDFVLGTDSSFSGGRVVTVLPSSQSTYAQATARVRNGLVLARGEERTIYLRAEYYCGSGPRIVSNVVTFKPHRDGRPARPLRRRDWIERAAQRFITR